MLTVHNRNNFDFIGRYGGIDYNFPQGKITVLPDDAAKHIFGVGLIDKTEIMTRHGWVTHSHSVGVGHDILNKFCFNVADNLESGQVIEPEPEDSTQLDLLKQHEEIEQGSAPLQTGSSAEADASDGTKAKAEQPTTNAGEGESILDTLSNLGGANKTKK